MKYYVFLLLVVLLIGCKKKPDKENLAEIKTMSWTWVSGERNSFGDFIDFEDNWYELKEDSIFKKSVYKGRITGYNSKYREITIETADKMRLIYYSHDFR